MHTEMSLYSYARYLDNAHANGYYVIAYQYYSRHDQHHPILWKEASVVDQARTRKELLLKKALHIGLTSEEQRFNRNVGLELQGYWVSTLKALGK